MTNEVPSKGLEWTNLVLGAGLACAGFAFTEMPAAAWNAGIVGALIACCSAVALYRYGAWTEWSNLGLGCWGVAAPFLLGFGSAQAATWTHALVGLCVATIAIIQLSSGRKAQILSRSDAR
ncbi:SPW repeat protein [Mesorhizobium muleiense]|uniref:SPW repeat-containing protein n=1 Tax=Mesorhizobium muleiense TaxID=1004279 RepID=A0A1G9D0Q3_9HYPH|nr:SPW repeat protein [Mesorhizobium muleiense]MCF6102693.1 SPW repeat protein [Mesorhizobium muleiense]SDK57274.1 SPW repeat-containing protein [Mesorhizobium muleiense]